MNTLEYPQNEAHSLNSYIVHKVPVNMLIDPCIWVLDKNKKFPCGCDKQDIAAF